MREGEFRPENFAEFSVAESEMIDPDRRVDQYHVRAFSRRLGTPRSLGSVPPSALKRRAASRAISAWSPA